MITKKRSNDFIRSFGIAFIVVFVLQMGRGRQLSDAIRISGTHDAQPIGASSEAEATSDSPVVDFQY
jgi:hypothetical protein